MAGFADLGSRSRTVASASSDSTLDRGVAEFLGSACAELQQAVHQFGGRLIQRPCSARLRTSDSSITCGDRAELQFVGGAEFRSEAARGWPRRW